MKRMPDIYKDETLVISEGNTIPYANFSAQISADITYSGYHLETVYAAPFTST